MSFYDVIHMIKWIHSVRSKFYLKILETLCHFFRGLQYCTHWKDVADLSFRILLNQCESMCQSRLHMTAREITFFSLETSSSSKMSP